MLLQLGKKNQQGLNRQGFTLGSLGAPTLFCCEAGLLAFRRFDVLRENHMVAFNIHLLKIGFSMKFT